MANPIAVPGTNVPSGAAVSPGGAQGVQGVQGLSGPVGTLPVGTVILYVAGGTPPASWMACDGSAVSRTTYPDLFTAIGTTYGTGDGSTTFNLPDLRGRTAVGVGQGTGLTNRALAAVGGEENHALATTELASHLHSIAAGQFSHTHGASDSGHNHGMQVSGSSTYDVGGGGGAVWWLQPGGPGNIGTGTNSAAITVGANTLPAGTTDANGSGTGHNTMQPFLALFFIIKVSVSGGATAQAPIADTTQPGLMRTVSGNTTDFIDGTNNSQPLQPVITAVRLRSFNAIGNPNFECNQRLTGGTMQANTSQWTQDRWVGYNTTGVTPYWGPATSQSVTVPGTNFMISQAFSQLNIQSTSKPSLAATDQTIIQQSVEGSVMRELMNDVHSISILAQTNVAGGLKFALLLQDSGTSRTLAKLCTIASPNIWTLIQLPNLPIWASGGAWSVVPGNVGYGLIISVAAGSSQIPPANDTWQNGNFRGAVGMDNILSKPSNSQLWIAFIQHEPGPLCTTLIDCPFQQNLEGCCRYFQKSCDYKTALYTATPNGQIVTVATANGYPNAANILFNPRMAKVPTCTGWSSATGTYNTVRDNTAAADRAINTGGWGAGETGFSGFGTASVNSAAASYQFHYNADTGW